MPDAVDFFVSYTSADRPWAEWIAWELEQAGHSTVVQAWDMQPGSNFVVEMHEATRVAERTIAVLSPAFLESEFCRAEWGAAFRRDPTGRERRLVPVRVRACDPDGLLGAIVYVDLVGLEPGSSREALLAGVSAAQPARAPGHPGAESSAHARRPDAGAAVFDVPVMTRTFIGRERMLERLASGVSGDGAVEATRVDAIHGLGGVGKTWLAARYARTHRDAYDVIWWLRAEQPATLRADLAALAVALGLVDVDVEALDAVAAAREWLDRNGRWLLVFDDVAVPAAIAELVPEGEGGHVLITSRAHGDWQSLNARAVALDVWERVESREFLTARTGERDAGVLDEVAALLGDLPLALEQAAAYTNTKAITLSGYLQRLRDRDPELFAAGHTVAPAWSLALTQLAEVPVAEELARVCAHLAPERIPCELLDAWVDVGDDPALTPRVVDEAVELLLRHGLLTATADSTLGMHRLVQDVVRASAGTAASAAHAIALVDFVLPDASWEHEQWPVCERLLEHALRAANHAEEHHAARAQTAAMLTRVGRYQQARAEYATARELFERALAIEEAVHGREHPDVAITLGNLGSVQGRLGELQAARESQQRALEIAEAVHAPDQPGVARALADLGIVQEQLGELGPARVALQRALAIQEAACGPEDSEVARTLTSLGDVQRQLGELKAARVTLQRALAIDEAVYGGRHPEVAITLGILGIAQQQLGELRAARATLQRALAIKEAVFGRAHPEVAITLGNLGTVQQQLGELEVAFATLERALAIKEAVFGPEHPEVAITLSNLGGLLAQLGELDAARVTLERALATQEAVHGREHANVARTLGNLGIVQEQLGDLPASRASLARALAIFERSLGRGHPTTRMARKHLSSLGAGTRAGSGPPTSPTRWSRLRRG